MLLVLHTANITTKVTTSAMLQKVYIRLHRLYKPKKAKSIKISQLISDTQLAYRSVNMLIASDS